MARKKLRDEVEETPQKEMFTPKETNFNLFVVRADVEVKGVKYAKGDTVELDSVSTQKWLKKRNII